MIPFHRFPGVESFRPAGPGEFSFSAEPAGGGVWLLTIEVSGRSAVVRVLSLSNGHPGLEPRPLSLGFSFYSEVRTLEIEGPDGVRRELACERGAIAWTGRRRHRVWRSPSVSLV